MIAWLIHIGQTLVEIKKMLKNLQDALDGLKKSMDALIAKANDKIEPAALQPMVDQVAAMKSAVDAVVAPPAPPAQ